MSASTNCDVIVVGAGPVGLITALLLRQSGHHVKLYERYPTRLPIPRAVGLGHQGARLINALGLLPTMLSQEAMCPVNDNAKVRYVTGDPNEILLDFVFAAPTSISGLQGGYFIHQPTFEEIAETACAAQGVEICRSCEITDVIDHDDYIEVKHGAFKEGVRQSTVESITAKFVIGCDGSNSIVRKAAGIDLHVHKPAMSRWMVVDVIPKDIEQSLKWKDRDYAKQYLDPKRPRTTVPSPVKRRRFEFMLHAHESAEESTKDEFLFDLLAEFGPDPTNAIIEKRAIYTIQGAWAETFVKGRIALAGDAAHQAPQFLGQGLNSGLRDSVNIAWRVDFALKQPVRADWRRLLSDYSNEQRGITEIFVIGAKAVEAMLTESDPKACEMRNAHLKSTPQPPFPNLERVAGPGTHLGADLSGPETEDKPGNLFIQGRVRDSSGQPELFDSVGGKGWTLYTKVCKTAEEVLSQSTSKTYTEVLDGKMAGFGNAGYEDVDGVYAQWFEKTGNEAVLVRPDNYVFGASKTQDGIEGLVKSAIEKILV